MSATMSPWSSPTRWRRRKDAAEPSSSITRCCRPWSISPRRKPARPRSMTSRPTTPSFNWHLGDKAATDAAFAKAAACHQARPRQQPPGPERRSSRARRSANTTPGTEHFTLYTTSQNPHVARLVLSAFIGIAPEHKLRVIAPDVGGGFGSKIFIYAEETVCVWAAQEDRAARSNGRPIARKRSCRDAHGRDHVTHAELAIDADGKILGLRVRRSPISAPISRPSPRRCRPISTRRCCPASTTSRRSTCEVDAVYTNTAPVDAYRGAGRPEATFVLERLVEKAARELGQDPAEFRRSNFITKFPHQTPVIMAVRRRRL